MAQTEIQQKTEKWLDDNEIELNNPKTRKVMKDRLIVKEDLFSEKNLLTQLYFILGADLLQKI